MEQLAQPLDEYMLAAYMAGTLPEAQRQAVAAHLAANAEARELLCMAYEMMEVPADAGAFAAVRPGADRHAKVSAASRRSPRWMRLTSYLSLAVLIFGFGITLFLAMNPAPDALRSQPSVEATQLAVEVLTPALQVQWTPIPDAYIYRLVIWDPQAARVVAEHETATTMLTGNDPFIQELRPVLTPDQSYTLRIDAIDARNRLIESSELVRFRLR